MSDDIVLQKLLFIELCRNTRPHSILRPYSASVLQMVEWMPHGESRVHSLCLVDSIFIVVAKQELRFVGISWIDRAVKVTSVRERDKTILFV